MAQGDWDAPRSEEGLQYVLRRLEECHEKGDLVETGNGLLALSYLVKWVRSDTASPPFVRSQELATQALDAFREAGHKQGQVRALVAGSVIIGPAAREAMLSEAESLAEALGDEDLVATVLGARARALAMTDRAKASSLHRQALSIYRRTGNERGQAACLFSLAIAGTDPILNRDYAVEAARIYRASGDPGEASRCIAVALMNAEEVQPLAEFGSSRSRRA